MKKIGIALFAVMTVIAALGAAAHAGYKENGIMTVYVNVASRTGQGQLADARNSPDTIAYIGCYVTSGSVGSPFMHCFAYDANRQYVACQSQNPTLVAAAQSISDDSFIYFNFDTSGQCTYMMVTNSSTYETK